MKLESLEGRQLLSATLTGTVYYDSDASQNQDPREKGLAGWSVYLDRNGNGQFDSGEPTSVTDRLGRYTFNKLSAGTYLVGVINKIPGDVQTNPGRLGAARGEYHIKLNLRTGMTAEERRAFVDAAQRWESVIQSEPTSFDSRAVQNVMTIDASVSKIDGVDGILGQATPTAYRSGDSLPFKGSMMFDRDDLQALIKNGQLEEVILHEMGHVLGFGTVWDFNYGLLTSTHNHHPKFNGANAVAAYDALFNTDSTYVPVQGIGGDGTANAHWDEDIFTDELMTGYVSDPGVPSPLSILTVAQFKDIGYNVDMAAADQWNPSRHRVIATTPLDVGGKAFERKVTVSSGATQSELSFGVRANSAPTLRVNAVSKTGRPGQPVLLSATATDKEGDGILGVTFFKESNGVAGLQVGAGGDTYIVQRTTSKRGIFQATAPSDSSAGSNVYYARVFDDLGFGRTKTASISLPVHTALRVAAYRPSIAAPLGTGNNTAAAAGRALDLTSPLDVTL